MGKHGTRGIALAVVIGALVIAPSAVGGRAGTSCLESATSGCPPVGDRVSGGTSKAKQQRAKLQPRIVFEQGGQQIWRAGNHLMY